MSAQRLVFFLSVCGLALLWAVLALSVSGTRFQYRNMIESIRAGEDLPGKEALNAAIASYGSAMHIAPCSAALHEDMALLLGQQADASADEDTAIATMQEELGARLSCRPADGKAWLDFAVMDIYREGFTDKAMHAYEMSARVAPGESWLAEKRLLFALQFRALLDADAMKVARADIAVLKRAHPNRMNEVLSVAEIKDERALEALFSAAPAK